MQVLQRPLKIGIIDSGIDPIFLRQSGLILEEAASFTIDWSEKRLLTRHYDRTDIDQWLAGNNTLTITDNSGHGTAVASILQRELQRPAIYYLAKILDHELSGSAICLTEAIHWLVTHAAVDAINMSLGTDNFHWQERIQNAVNLAQEAGCHLFSAAGDIPTLPSIAEGVKSAAIPALVQKHPHIKADWVALNPRIDIYQSGAWMEAAMATSYACPLMLACAYNSSLLTPHKPAV